MLGFDLVRRGARLHGARAATTHRETSLSFAQTAEMASRLANTLIARGIAPQDRVGVPLHNGRYSIPFEFGCRKAHASRGAGVAHGFVHAIETAHESAFAAA